jgi:hypothetical protein
MYDFFEVTAASGEGNGESFNRLPVAPHELILADAGYCSIAAIEVEIPRAEARPRANAGGESDCSGASTRLFCFKMTPFAVLNPLAIYECDSACSFGCFGFCPNSLGQMR